jgi:Ni/Co efflux regulator RcnB
MNHKAIMSAIVALSLVTGQLALAQGNGNRYERGQNDRNQNNPGQRYGEQDRRGNDARQNERDDNRGRGNFARQDERGAGPDHNFRRGGRLPSQYRGNQYVVNDWRGHHLSAPPRGYHWVQTGGDYVLVAIATGIILQLLLNQ